MTNLSEAIARVREDLEFQLRHGYDSVPVRTHDLTALLLALDQAREVLEKARPLFSIEVLKVLSNAGNLSNKAADRLQADASYQRLVSNDADCKALLAALTPETKP